MLYKKNTSKKLDPELFKNPTSEYRGKPFWAWNGVLHKDKLLEQIEYFKEMGLGGFYMHTRAGMATEYLSDEFMDLIKSCAEKAKEEEMLPCLYDEDRWPSGAAGGFVTKNPEYRQKCLLFSVNKLETISKEQGVKEGKPYLIASFDIVLNKKGELKSYKIINDGEKASRTLWHAYVVTAEENGWYNGQTYVDTMSKEAIAEFIRITHERYFETVGDEFGKSIPTIFTDEPQIFMMETLKFAEDKSEIRVPWTTDFPETFKETYGFDLTEKLPEIFWDKQNGEISFARYAYHDHTCERFAEAFFDQCGKWCKEHNIVLTGHVMEEPNLFSQTHALGEAMRTYRGFELPGIDMLCNSVELSTAKQAQSASHQYGREGVLSELYGVTNWTFDFRGHKFQGDWQAALGVTERVHHLSWYSMKGSAKRDYPASISYQSPWYKNYSYVEDHFARINTALTRGVPDVNVAVIHPIESYWLHWGPSENTSGIRREKDINFINIIEWLLLGTIDFDFICESTLPGLCGEISDNLEVGKMKYKAVVVPNLETIRKSTLEILKKFAEKGGKVIVAGDIPKYIDAKPASNIEEYFEKAVKIPYESEKLLSALEDERFIEIRSTRIDVSHDDKVEGAEDGGRSINLIYNLREDNGVKWLFIAHAKKFAFTEYEKKQKIFIKIKGCWTPKLYDTMTGEIHTVPYTVKDGVTQIDYDLYLHDSLLFSLEPSADGTALAKKVSEGKVAETVNILNKVNYRREEPNVILLDEAEYSIDGREFMPLDEIMRLDESLRKTLGYPLANGVDVQPWAIPAEKIEHYVTLRFKFNSEIETSAQYAFEEAVEVILNNEAADLTETGWFIDKDVKTINLPKIRKGENILEVKMPFSKRIGIEPSFIIGDFDIALNGTEKTIKEKSSEISFGNITDSGMPFYGGNIIYETEISTPSCDLEVSCKYFRGNAVEVLLDGVSCGIIAISPYKLTVNSVGEGTHKIEFKLFGNRNNTYGALHNIGCSNWYGPDYWYPDEDDFIYEYKLSEMGIMSSPTIKIIEN